jgi:hypothetical protein
MAHLKLKKMKKILLLICIVTLVNSCDKKDKEDIIIQDITSAVVNEIINPPEAPEIYSNSSVEPEIRIKNNGTIDITSIAIGYNIDVNNTGGGYSIGPTTTWFGSIKPQNDTVIVLDKWESYAGRPPLIDGTHMLYINIKQINSEPYYEDNNDLVKSLFILEE